MMRQIEIDFYKEKQKKDLNGDEIYKNKDVYSFKIKSII